MSSERVVSLGDSIGCGLYSKYILENYYIYVINVAGLSQNELKDSVYVENQEIHVSGNKSVKITDGFWESDGLQRGYYLNTRREIVQYPNTLKICCELKTKISVPFDDVDWKVRPDKTISDGMCILKFARTKVVVPVGRINI